MKFAINVEFTDEELRKYAEDVGRRLAVNTIHEVITHLPAIRLDPSVASTMAHAFMDVFSKKAQPPAGPQQKSDPGPIATGVPDAHFLSRCRGLGESVTEDSGWVCCRCGHYNGEVRPSCRSCKHDRCDIIVTPPPAETDESSTPA